tara:strand:+ start:911 stop:2782 length:1872 start_codon:yes stop_codon:yes gene_type:complete
MNYSKYKNNLFIFFATIFSIFIVSMLWSKINLPYFNKYKVVGVYSNLNHSSYNDIVRYVVFIFMPILTFLISLLIFKKKEFINLKDLLLIKNNKYDYYQTSSKIIFFYLFSFLLLIAIEFLSLNMPDFKMDYWHDGDYLTAAKNYSINNKIWKSSYAVHGASMSIYPNLMWKLFNIESIGAYRLFHWFLIILVKSSCLYFAYLLSKIVLLKETYKNIFFIIFSFLILSMSNFASLANGYNLISFRDLYLVLFLILLFNIIILDKTNLLHIVLITVVPSVTMLLHTDIGIYLNFSLIFLVLYFYLINKKKIILTIVTTFLSFWLLTILFIGYNEFLLFIKNIPIMASSIDYLHGWVYPEPFFDIGESKHASRATKGLLLQLLAGLIVTYKIFIKNKNFDNRKKIFFLFLFLLSFIFYRTALGRSDAYHIRMSGELPLIIISFFCIEYILIYMEKFKIFPNKKIINYFTIIFFSLSIFYIAQSKFNYQNIKNIKKRYINFVQLDDEYFMEKDVINLVNYLKEVTIKDQCIQNFTNNHAIPYFLKKNSCTPYYASILASPNILQEDYILKLKAAKPEYIIYISDKYTFDGIKVYERLKTVNNYINLNYDFHKKIDGYTIFKSLKVN